MSVLKPSDIVSSPRGAENSWAQRVKEPTAKAEDKHQQLRSIYYNYERSRNGLNVTAMAEKELEMYQHICELLAVVKELVIVERDQRTKLQKTMEQLREAEKTPDIPKLIGQLRMRVLSSGKCAETDSNRKIEYFEKQAAEIERLAEILREEASEVKEKSGYYDKVKGEMTTLQSKLIKIASSETFPLSIEDDADYVHCRVEKMGFNQQIQGRSSSNLLLGSPVRIELNDTVRDSWKGVEMAYSVATLVAIDMNEAAKLTERLKNIKSGLEGIRSSIIAFKPRYDKNVSERDKLKDEFLKLIDEYNERQPQSLKIKKEVEKRCQKLRDHIQKQKDETVKVKTSDSVSKGSDIEALMQAKLVQSADLVDKLETLWNEVYELVHTKLPYEFNFRTGEKVKNGESREYETAQLFWSYLGLDKREMVVKSHFAD